MTDYDDFFAEIAADESVFAEKGVLDPLADPRRSSPATSRNAGLCETRD